MYRMTKYLVMFFLVLTGVLKSQINYEMSLKNEELVNQNTFEFDVFIKSTSGSFVLTSYQCAFTFNRTIKNGGALSFSYIGGSSVLSNIPNTGIGIKTDNNSYELTFASMPGSDEITTSSARLGRFRLVNTNPFPVSTPFIINIKWDFDGAISTIITGSGFANITNPANHISHIKSYTFVNIVQAIATDTINASQHPGKTIDGVGFYDNDENSKWVSYPTPKWIIFDLGYILKINLARFSFYNFNLGRGYDYSVQVSEDMINWQNISSNARSGLTEWEDIIFDQAGARYVKLIMHSSQDLWAGIWEAEIWSSDLTPLPVELTNFILTQKGKDVELTWQTTSEIMNYGFEIQRSVDQNEWDVLGFVNGYGNSNIPRDYIFLDDNILHEALYYYRLKQIDTDGTFEYSPVLEIYISIPTEISLLQNYPNPFNPATSIVFILHSKEEKVNITVLNILGEKVAEVITNELFDRGKHEVHFDGSRLASGIYFYALQTENFSQTKKMLLIK